MAPIKIDGTDITGATIDGTEVQEITVDGQTVFSAGPEPGRHFYLIEDRSAGQILHYDLATPFDIDNKGSPTSVLNTGIDTGGMAISNDGTIIYAVTWITSDLQKYNLSTPFDLSSAGSPTNLTFGDTNKTAFAFADNGTKFYTSSGSVLEQFDCSTPFDVTTRSGPTASLGGFPTTGPGDPAFSPDGTQVVIGERDGTTITGGTCSTPFDLDTFNQTDTFNTSDADPTCAKWNADGTTLFVRHASPDMVNEFSTPNAYSLNGLSFVKQVFDNPRFAQDGIDFNYTN